MLDSLVTRPTNSIIHQSFHSHERSDPLNGDGFGVAWYARDLTPFPAVFRSITPAWNNHNLLALARVTQSDCILAHVRAASPGMAVTETNCHPFASGAFAFMHNGSVAEFPRVKRALLASLSDETFGQIEGSTDSEHVFAIFMDEYRRAPTELSPVDRMAEAMSRTLRSICELTRRAGIQTPSFLNLAVSDGKRALVSRFTSVDGALAPSLHVHVGKRYVCEDGKGQLVSPDETGGGVLVCSEPLSDDPGWLEVPNGSLVLVKEDRTVEMRPFLPPTSVNVTLSKLVLRTRGGETSDQNAS